MLSVFPAKKGGGGHKDTFGSDGNAYYLDCGDSNMRVCL